MNKLLKKLIALGMSFILIGSNGIYLHAEEKTYDNEEQILIYDADAYKDNVIDESQMKKNLTNSNEKTLSFTLDKELETTSGIDVSGYEVGEIPNIDELQDIPQLYADLPENTNPNNAYAVKANTEYNGNITSTGELRWYAFDISQKSKVSILVIPNSGLDADIHMFQLEPNTMNLFGTEMNATSGGVGEQEYFSYIMDAGIYFFAVNGYSGTGAYILDFFSNANYIDGEINDTINTAQSIDCTGTYEGLIDTVCDIDCYKVTVSNPTFIQVAFSSNMSYNMQWVLTSADERILTYKNQIFLLGAGTHYFGVYSPKNEFSISEKYIITLNVTNAAATNELAPENAYNNWNYTLNDTDQTIKLNYYTGTETNVTVYGLYEVNQKIYRTKIASNAELKGSGYMFAGNNYTQTIEFGRNIDTSETSGMACMFRSCSKLTNIEISNLDTSNVTTMYRMFDDCIELRELNLLGLDTRKVKNMQGMFERCFSLTSLGCHFYTSSVTDMKYMFKDCRSVTSLDLGAFDTTNVRTMFGMFMNCYSLESVNVSSFNTRNVREFGSMFESCRSLPSLDISNFYLDAVPQYGDMSFVFYNCKKLKAIYVNLAWVQKTSKDNVYALDTTNIREAHSEYYVYGD